MTTEQEAQLYTLIHDCLDAYEMLSSQILTAPDRPLEEEEIFTIANALHTRFRALAPDYPGVLPLETPNITETLNERVVRLSKE